MNTRYVELLILVAVALSGCSDPKDASKDNFAAALSRELAHDRECLQLKLPAEFFVEQRGRVDSDQQTLDALVGKGLVVKRTEVKEDWRHEKSDKDIYELAPQGEKFSQGKTENPFGPSSVELCYGVGKVEEVTNFSAPNSALGETVSQVQYTYKVHDVADWANDPVLLENWRIASAVRGEAIEDQAMLMLTANGWLTNDEFVRGRSGSAASAR